MLFNKQQTNISKKMNYLLRLSCLTKTMIEGLKQQHIDIYPRKKEKADLIHKMDIAKIWVEVLKIYIDQLHEMVQVCQSKTSTKNKDLLILLIQRIMPRLTMKKEFET